MATKKPVSRNESLPQQARSLLTAAERKLLESSFGSALAKASHDAASATLARVRELRNKWRDLYAKQSRSTKRTNKTPAAVPGALATAAASANDRSREKSDLFDAAIRRIEARLSELMAAAGSKKPEGKKPESRKPAAITKTASKRLAGKKAKAKKTSGARSRKALSPDTLGTLSAASAGQAVRFDRAQQRSAKTAARVARGRIEGSSTRNSHMVALGRRAQVRRDLRNK